MQRNERKSAEWRKEAAACRANGWYAMAAACDAISEEFAKNSCPDASPIEAAPAVYAGSPLYDMAQGGFGA